jgi:hypothetical protein
MSGFAALLRRDVRGIYRDGFLLAMTGFSLVIALVLRLLVPRIPITHLELYVAPFVILMATGLIGTVFGFALIEERETRTSLLMRILPVRSGTLTTYWVVVVGGFCLVICLVSAVIYGVWPANMPAFLLLCAVTALGTPVVMLLLGTLASNKIEGLAVSKIISGSSMLLVAVFVLPPRWHIGLFWYPWYWLYLGLLEAWAGPDIAGTLVVRSLPLPLWAHAVVPLGMSIWGLAVLARRYRRVI